MALVSLTGSSSGTSSTTASQPAWLDHLQLGQSPEAAVATTSVVVGTVIYLSPRVFVLR